jgi:hypothetical protein
MMKKSTSWFPARAPKMRYEATSMTHSDSSRIRCATILSKGLACVLLTTILSACGASVVRSGAGVGAVGRGLALHAADAPQAAQTCLWQDSLGPQPAGAEKSMLDTCSKAFKSDALWRRAILVLSLYGARLESVASGADIETSGKLEASLSGVTGAGWSDADDQAARDAVTTLVNQMGATTDSHTDLSKLVQDAAPPVKTLCDGIGGYLDTQSQNLVTIRKDIDKKRMSKAIRRCGMLEKQTICVADTVVDRMVYADVFGQTITLESKTLEARDQIGRFCVAHERLASAAGNGQLSKKQTYFDIVDAVKVVPRAEPQWNTGDTPKTAEKPAAGKPSDSTKK